MSSLSVFLKKETYALLKNFIDREKKKAMREKNLTVYADLTKTEDLLKRGGGILKKQNPYINFMAKCLIEKKSGNLMQTQKNMRECASQWNTLTDEEKKRWKRGEYELVNLPSE